MKSILNNPIIYLWHKMYHYAGNRKKHVILAGALIAISTMIYSAMPLVFSYFLNFVQKNGINEDNVFKLLLILSVFFMCELLSWAFWGPARIIEQKTSFFVDKNYKEYLLTGVLAMPVAWHTDHHSGDTIDKIEKGTKAISDFSESSFEFINALVQMIFAFGALLYLNLFTSAIVIFMSVFIFYIMLYYDKKLVPGYSIVNKMDNKTSAKVYDVISNITTVIILRVESLVLKAISKTIDVVFPQFKENAINNEFKWFYAASLGQLSLVLAMCFYIFENINTEAGILVGSLYIIYSYSSRVRETFFSFAHLYNKAVRWKSSISNSEELSKEFSDVRSFKQKYLPDNWQDISIKNLSFSYHGKDNKNLHLDDINLSFKKGAKIAVIGESGGGKTTFLKLLRGLYEPQKMTLEINGKKSNKDFNDISESISLIPQDPEIFSTTIRENITLGVDYSDREIKKYTDMASFSDVVKRLPNKLESNIVEKGVNLSGGEKQRLALARGLLASKEKEIVLLDEPTSSVDFHNELKIYENIFSSFPKKTVISSIHRLHLLSLFDEIFFFKNGRIIAHGDLKYLQENSPDFVSLWEKYLKTQENT